MSRIGIAILLMLAVTGYSAGLMSQPWHWGPRSNVRSVATLAANSAHTVHGVGQVIQVGLTWAAQVYDMRSPNNGLNWGANSLGHDDNSVGSEGAALTYIGCDDHRYVAVFEDWYRSSGDLKCRVGSTDFGDNQTPADREQTISSGTHNVHACPTVSGIQIGSEQFFEATWTSGLTGNPTDVKACDGHMSNGGAVWDSPQGVGGPTDFSCDEPSIDMRVADNTAYAACVFTGCYTSGDYHYICYRRHEHGNNWGQHYLTPGGDGTELWLTHPVIAFNPNTNQEVIVYQDEDEYGGNQRLLCAYRMLDISGQDSSDWETSVVAEDDEVVFTNPNLWYDANAFYLTYTATDGDGNRQVFFAISSDDGVTWAEDPMPLSQELAHADSASVCVTDAKFAYAVFGNVEGSDHIVYYRRGYSVAQVWPPVAEDGMRTGIARVSEDGAVHAVSPVADFINCEVHDADGDRVYQDAPGYGDAPSLAMSPAGYPIVTYRRNDSIFSAAMRADSGWAIQTLYAGTATQHVGSPSLAVFPNATGRIGNVCFAVYNTSTSGSKIVYIQFDTTGDLKQNRVDSFPGSYGDSCCCISVASTDSATIVYQHGANVYKRRLQYSPTTNSTIPDTWPAASTVNSPGNATARYPFCERIGSRLWVTYSYEDQGDWVIKRVSCLDTGTTTTWEGEANLSNVDANPKYWPVLSTPYSVAWTESLETHCAIMANISDSLLQLTGDTSCCYVSLLADTAIRETPSTNMTRVRYLWLQNYSGDTWTVPYAEKDIRVSDAEANVTRYNQGAKLAIASDDSLSSVYRTSQGSIYFCRQKDGDAGWSTSLLSNSGESPAVANSCHDRIWTCERDATSPTAHVIRCHNRATGSNTWQSFTVYSVSAVGPTGSRLGPPAIAACPNDSSGSHDAAYITFTVYTSLPPKSTIVKAKVDTGSVVYVDSIHSVASVNDSFPSVALPPVSTGPGYAIEASWQNGSEVYTRKTTNYDHPEFTTKRTWNPAYNLSNTQTNSRHPLIAANGDTILVVWVESDSGRILVKGQNPTADYNSWGDTVNVSQCPNIVTDYPGIALGDSNIVTYQKKLSSTNYDIIARVNFHSDLNLSNSSTKSTYDHSLFYLAGGTTPVITSVWTEELSPSYAEVAFQRWELGQSGGGGEQSATVFDPGIRPMLYAPAPNPFNGLTNIRYQTNIRGMTRVSVMDITGRRVRNLLTMPQSPGIYNLTWNARDDRERQLPRGVYFVRLETTNYSEARKLILTE
jgi:hypothetical protein